MEKSSSASSFSSKRAGERGIFSFLPKTSRVNCHSFLSLYIPYISHREFILGKRKLLILPNILLMAHHPRIGKSMLSRLSKKVILVE